MLITSSIAFGSSSFTEDQLIERIEHNKEIQSLKNNLSSAESLRGKLLRSFLPKINLTYGREKYSTGPYDQVNQPFGGIEAKINIFNSGRDEILDEKNKNLIRVSELDLVLKKEEVKYELRRALAHLAFLNEMKVILSDALAFNESNLNSAKKRINAGLSTQSDLLDFKQQKIMLQQDLESLKFEYGVTLRMISSLIGEEINHDLSITHLNSHPDHGNEQKSNVELIKTYNLQKQNLLVELASLEKQEASRWWTPYVEVYSYAQRFTQKEREYDAVSDRNDIGVGFKITLPIFDGGDSLSINKSTEFQFQTRKFDFENEKLNLQRKIQDVNHKLELAHELIHGAEENVKIMEQYRKLVLSEYAKGVKNSPDVLGANQRWISARENFAEVKKNYHFANAEAMYLMSSN